MAVAVAENQPLRSVPDFERVQKQKEWRRQQDIFHEAMVIGGDYIDASGELPTVENLTALHRNGYLNHSPQEIMAVAQCETLEELQGLIRTHHEDESLRTAMQKTAILEDVDADLQAGLVMPELFRESLPFKSFGQLAVEADGARSKFDIVVPLDLEVPVDEKIRRYYTFKVVQLLTPNLDETAEQNPQRPLPLVRRTSIALGYNLNTKKKYSSLGAELSKCNTTLDSPKAWTAVERVADEQGWLDYVDPSLRQKYLEQLKGASTTQEYFFDLTSKKIVVLGKTAIEDFRRDEGHLYLQRLAERHQLLLGKAAIGKVYADDGNILPTVVRLGDILSGGGPYVKVKQSKNRYFDWKREDYLSYGRFLMGHAEINIDTIFRAYNMGLGPSREIIIHPKRFRSLDNYFSRLGFRNRLPANPFAKWKFEDYVTYGQQVLEQYGEINTTILRQNYQNSQRKDVPSPWTIDHYVKGGLRALRYALGCPANNLRLDAADILERGVVFANQYGRAPTKTEIDALPEFCSSKTVQNHFFKISTYRQAVQTEYERRLALNLAAAA